MSDPGAPKTPSLTTLAQLIELTPRQVQNLAKDGWVKKPYSVPSVVRGYIASLKNQITRLTQRHADSRIGEARAQKIEFEVATAQKRFISTDVAIGMVDEVFGPLRSDLEGLPAQFTRDMEERRRLDGLIGVALNAAADRMVESRAAVLAGGTHSSPQAAAVARRVGADKSPIPGKRGRPRSSVQKMQRTD